MKMLHIQVQPERAALDERSAIGRLRAVADDPTLGGWVRVTEGEENGRYVNIDFGSEDLARLWRQLRPVVLGNPSLAGCSIVACEGAQGWDDYLLLHHFDSTESLDELG